MLRESMAAAAGFAALMLAGAATAGPVLDTVKGRGAVACGVGLGTAGYMLADSTGKWKGLSVDVCRAVAAAIFGDAEKVNFKLLTSKQRFTAFPAGESEQ